MLHSIDTVFLGIMALGTVVAAISGIALAMLVRRQVQLLYLLKEEMSGHHKSAIPTPGPNSLTIKNVIDLIEKSGSKVAKITGNLARNLNVQRSEKRKADHNLVPVASSGSKFRKSRTHDSGASMSSKPSIPKRKKEINLRKLSPAEKELLQDMEPRIQPATLAKRA